MERHVALKIMTGYFYNPFGLLKSHDQLVHTLKSKSFREHVTTFNALCESGEMADIFDGNQKNILKAFSEILAIDFWEIEDDDEDDNDEDLGGDSQPMALSDLFRSVHDKDEIIRSMKKVKRDMKKEFNRLKSQADLIASEIENDPLFASGISGNIKSNKKNGNAKKMGDAKKKGNAKK